ncbi:hypothetical protein [Schlesneria paludicola]|uniref:hypothetical protein n=1 Tax=Schlesneria paludicola TaxID=360056 RepID=UPI00029B0A18|nr:hypothetical protein [Schlesneria paludicola]
MDRFPISPRGLWLTAMLIISEVARSADDDLLEVPNAPPANFLQQRLIIAAPQVLDAESMIFGRDIPAAKERLEKSIANAIEEACRGYDLPEQIRHRIEMAAQVDKVRLFRKIEDLRTELKQAENDHNQKTMALRQIQDLRKQQANLLDQNSFFAKSRKTLLARVPSIDPEMTIDNMKRSRHRSNVDKSLDVIGRHAFASDDTYKEFTERVFQETLPDEPFDFRDLLLVKYRIGMMARHELEPLFAKNEWPRVSKMLAHFQDRGRLLFKGGPQTEGKEFEQPLLVEHEVRAVRVFEPRLINQRPNERQMPVANRAAPIVDPALLLTRHRANIDAAVRAVERQVRLRPEQRKAVTELLLKEVQPPRQFGNFDDLVVQYSLSQLSDEQLKPLFDENQWPKVLQEFARIDQFRPMLKVHGLIHKPSTRHFPAIVGGIAVSLQAADATLPSNQWKD